MGDKPIIISNDMNNLNHSTQHTRNNKTFAEITSNVVLPKMNQAIVFNSINNIKQIEYVTALSKIIPAENIQFVSRISNNRFCVFFNSQAVMENLLKTHSSIIVNEIEIPIRRLINASKRIILSNVYPTIPNQLIINALNEQGIKTTSQISLMKAGFSTEQFSHILSFRRQVYINEDSVSKLPSSITVTVESTTFRIFISDDTVTCFQCHQTGHFSNQCKNIPEQIIITNGTETVMETLDPSSASNTGKNTSLSWPILSTQNTYNTQDNDISIPSQVKDTTNQTFKDPPKKLSLTEKLQSSSNKNIKETSPKQVKRPAPPSPSHSLSPISPHLSSPSATMEPPNAPDVKTQQSKNIKGNVNKKPKVRTSTSSNDSFYSNIEEWLDPAQDLFDSNPVVSLSFSQFKDFFENAQGCTDLENLCLEYQTSSENIIEIIKTVYPVVSNKSVKNRLTRLLNALKKIQDFSHSQTSNVDCNEDEIIESNF